MSIVEAPWQPNLLLDKEWIVCDNGAASPHRGSCYVTYSDFRTLRLEFQASRDGGLTWESQVSAPENAGRASIVGRWAPAPQPVVRPNGDLVVPFYDENRVASVRSMDGGRSFQPPVTDLRHRLQGDAEPPRPAPAKRRGGRGRKRLRRLAGLPASAVVQRQRPGAFAIGRRRHLVAGDADPDEATRLACRLRPPRDRRGREPDRPDRGRVLRPPRRAPRRRLHLLAERRPDLAPGSAPERPDDAARVGRAGRRRDARRLLLDVVVGRPSGLGVHARIPAGRAVRPAPLRDPHPALGPAGLVQLRVDLARGPRRDARHALELLLRRGQELLRRAEVLEQCPPTRRADARKRVEDRLARLRIAALTVEAEREAMGLVPNTLEQLQTG